MTLSALTRLGVHSRDDAVNRCSARRRILREIYAECDVSRSKYPAGSSISGRLSELKYLGLVDCERVNGMFVWWLTANGISKLFEAEKK